MLTPLPSDSPVDLDNTLLNHYLIATWAKICQALGPEFEPCLPVVMPPLVSAASAKADISVYGERAVLSSPSPVSNDDIYCRR